MYPVKKINKHALPITKLNRGRFDFQSSFDICFIVDLLMEHKFCCVNLIGRSWRT
jgi:hypothetical protein